MAKKDKLKFVAISEKFGDFLSKLEDLTEIGDIVKMKIDSDSILMYSLIGETAVLAFKSYQLKTEEYFKFEDFDYKVDYVINGAKRLVKSLNFLNVKNEIILEFSHKDSPDNTDLKQVRALSATDSRLTLTNIGGEHYKIRDMDKARLDKILDPKNSKWSFKAKVEDFSDVKKLSKIGDDKIISINVVEGKVTFSELTKWQLDIDTIDEGNYNLVFGKKYLNCVNLNEEYVNFNIHETFILIKDKESNLMLSFEQSFDDEE